MKQKILDLIKAKYPTLTIPKKILDAVAAKVESKCGGDEALIEAQLEIYEDFNPIGEQVKQFDRIATAEAKAKNPGKKEDQQEQKTEDQKNDQTQESATDKLLREVLQELAVIKGEKVQNTIKGKIDSELKDKVPPAFYSLAALPSKEEDIPAFVETVSTNYASFIQTQTDAGVLTTTGARQSVGGKPSDTKPASKEELDAVAKTLNI